VQWLIEREWARRADDVLWRRTKKGLHFSKDETAVLEEYMSAIPVEMAG
jgi:glycerol-3-phosphate dehydrogenase